MIFTPDGGQVCQGCSTQMVDAYKGSDAKLRAWGCLIVVAGLLGGAAGMMTQGGLGMIAGAVLGVMGATAIKTFVARKQAGV